MDSWNRTLEVVVRGNEIVIRKEGTHPSVRVSQQWELSRIQFEELISYFEHLTVLPREVRHNDVTPSSVRLQELPKLFDLYVLRIVALKQLVVPDVAVTKGIRAFIAAETEVPKWYA